MEDFLKFLLIAGVILVGIFKEVNKNSKSKKAKNKRPVSPMPPPVEVAPDAVPMPEAWGGPKSLEELFQPKPIAPPTRKKHSPQTPPGKVPKQKKKREEVSVAASLANSAAQDQLNNRQGSHYDALNKSSDNNEDFTIHSAEEARRAIIWGEILQRKY